MITPHYTEAHELNQHPINSKLILDLPQKQLFWLQGSWGCRALQWFKYHAPTPRLYHYQTTLLAQIWILGKANTSCEKQQLVVTLYSNAMELSWYASTQPSPYEVVRIIKIHTWYGSKHSSQTHKALYVMLSPTTFCRQPIGSGRLGIST